MATSAALTSLLACSERLPAPPEHQPSEPAPSEPDVEALLALGYTDHATDKADPARMGVVHHDTARAYPGYNLFTIRAACTVQLIDMGGKVIRRWQRSPCEFWSHAILLENGNLLVTGKDERHVLDLGSRDERRFLMRMNWHGKLIWKRRFRAHHDTAVSASGELTTLTLATRRLDAIHPRVRTIDNFIARLSDTDEPIDQLSLYDIMSSNDVGFQLQRVRPGTSLLRKRIDLFHANSIKWLRPIEGRTSALYSAGNLLISIRHQDTVAIVDWRARRLLWAWGQGEFSGPHDATLLHNGNFLIFDNGVKRGWSRVVELDPDGLKLVWQYKAPNPPDFYTRGRGSSQRLANGNTLISESAKGHGFEVTRDGEIVWDYWVPVTNRDGHRGTLVRIKRLEVAFIQGLLGRSTDPRTQ